MKKPRPLARHGRAQVRNVQQGVMGTLRQIERNLTLDMPANKTPTSRADWPGLLWKIELHFGGYVRSTLNSRAAI
jgi:hypothetical protein